MKGSLRILSLALIASAGVAQAADFQITITNVGPQPLSPFYFAAADNSFNIFNVGGTSSLGIKDIAETGNTAEMLNITNAAGGAVGAFGVIGMSPLGPGDTRMMSFSTDMSHGFFSFATMLGKTNDGFLGESFSSMGLSLFSGSNPVGFDLTITGARAWDAGTELNTQNAADLAFLGGNGNPAENSGDDHIRVHAGIINGVGDSWDQMPAWSQNTDLLRVQVTPVPEPASMAVLGLGALALIRKRRNRKS
ncbi:MAG: spondin domain-containing protein [Fimbriimonadaceae bacterium]|nr:spondin domain-containing protein [Fimbriimonadaceae bacterium]